MNVGFAGEVPLRGRAPRGWEGGRRPGGGRSGDFLRRVRPLGLTSRALPAGAAAGPRLHPGRSLAHSCSCCWSEPKGCFFQEARPHLSPARTPPRVAPARGCARCRARTAPARCPRPRHHGAPWGQHTTDSWQLTERAREGGGRLAPSPPAPHRTRAPDVGPQQAPRSGTADPGHLSLGLGVRV